ncbi:MAG: hypothetical protein ACRDS9_26580, partial [Pseudonocardiaceae bacterium]
MNDSAKLLKPDTATRRRWDREHNMTAPLLLETHFQGRTLVVRPVGELLPETHARLRDGLLECAAGEPREIVVDLASMRAATASLL